MGRNLIELLRRVRRLSLGYLLERRAQRIGERRIYFAAACLILSGSAPTTNTAIASGKIRAIISSLLGGWLFWVVLCASVCPAEPALGQPSTESDAKSSSSVTIAGQEINSGDFLHATSILTEVIQADSHASADVYRMLAFSQFKLDRNEDALATCEHGLALYPSSDPLGMLYLLILHKEVSPEERRLRLESGVRQIPDSPILARALGEELLASNSQDSRALDLFSIAVKLSPNDAEAHFFYGESACFNQESVLLTLCIKELRHAYELAPSNQQANMQLYTMIAVAEDTLDDIKLAAEDFNRAMKANRTLARPSPYTAIKYATFLLSQNDSKQAAAITDEALKWDPSYGPAHFLRATLLAEQSKRADAVSEAELALQDSQSSKNQLRAYHFFSLQDLLLFRQKR